MDRDKQGIKRSTAVEDGEGVLINRRRHRSRHSSHDSPLLVFTLEHTSESVGGLPEGASMHRR